MHRHDRGFTHAEDKQAEQETDGRPGDVTVKNATGLEGAGIGASAIGFVAVLLASINVFGGFLVTHRMLSMFKKKQKKG